MLDNIERLNTDSLSYQQLRLTALAHDTFKYKVAETIAAHGKRINHGLLARRYMEKITDDTTVLDLIELHDEIYFSWRHEALHDNVEQANKRLIQLMGTVGDDLKLHYLFFHCDTMTGDKIQAPRFWFAQKMRELGRKDLVSLIARLNAMN